MGLIFFQSLMVISFEVICIFLFTGIFFPVREKWNYYARILLIVLMTLGIAFIAGYFGYMKMIKGIVLILFATIVLTIYFEARLYMIFFLFLIQYGILTSVDYVIEGLLGYGMPERLPIILNSAVGAVLLSLLCKMIFFCIVIVFKICWNKDESLDVVKKKEWMYFFYFPLFTFISVWIFIVNTQIIEQYAPEFNLIVFGLIFVNIIAFYLIKDIVKKETDIKNYELMQQSTKAQMAAYHNMNKEYDRQKKFIHDYKNQISCVQGMLTNGETMEALEFLNSLTGSILEEFRLINTGNNVIDSVINQKYSSAKSKGVYMIFSINDLSPIKMREEDIVSLLSNLLDNAVEACERIPEEPLISCKIMKQNSEFIIAISNPVKGSVKTEKGRLITTKTDANNHGIGLLSVKNVIEKYKGTYSISCDDNEYCFSAVLPIDAERAKITNV